MAEEPLGPPKIIPKAREKVPVRKGFTLMDWNRLTTTAPDLSGTGGRRYPITKQELSKHNTEEDCWMAIKGMVYNVTPYMDFHPGGREKLMKAAGRDGTRLFNYTHAWVNIENMMSKCYIGPLIGEAESAGEREDAESLKELTSFPAKDGAQIRN